LRHQVERQKKWLVLTLEAAKLGAIRALPQAFPYEFWALMQRIMPDYKEKKEWLRVNGAMMGIQGAI